MANDLGITESNLRNWKKQVDRHGSEAFLSSAERTDLEAENRRLRRELDIATEERDMLKKRRPSSRRSRHEVWFASTAIGISGRSVACASFCVLASRAYPSVYPP